MTLKQRITKPHNFSQVFSYSDDGDGAPACDGQDSEILGGRLSQINVYLYPFAIEFSLIGAILFYIMYTKIGHM